jgi:hypothetical protein
VLSTDIELYENATPLPRAFVVYEAYSVPDNDVGSEMALEVMSDPSFDPATSILISGDVPPPASEVASEGVLSEAEITEYSPTRIAVTARASAPAHLLLTDAYYPGWTVSVNGEPASLRRANVMFRAVAIPEGESQVVFEYRPAWYPAALVVGGLLWVGVSLVIIIQKRYIFS